MPREGTGDIWTTTADGPAVPPDRSSPSGLKPSRREAKQETNLGESLLWWYWRKNNQSLSSCFQFLKQSYSAQVLLCMLARTPMDAMEVAAGTGDALLQAISFLNCQKEFSLFHKDSFQEQYEKKSIYFLFRKSSSLNSLWPSQVPTLLPFTEFCFSATLVVTKGTSLAGVIQLLHQALSGEAKQNTSGLSAEVPTTQ